MIRHLSYTQKRFFFQQIQVSPRTLVISPRASFRVLEIVWNWLNPHGVVMKGFNVIQYMLQVLSVCHLWHVCGMFYMCMRGQVSVVEQIEEGISLALEKMFRYGYYFSWHFCCGLKKWFYPRNVYRGRRLQTHRTVHVYLTPRSSHPFQLLQRWPHW